MSKLSAKVFFKVNYSFKQKNSYLKKILKYFVVNSKSNGLLY